MGYHVVGRGIRGDRGFPQRQKNQHDSRRKGTKNPAHRFIQRRDIAPCDKAGCPFGGLYEYRALRRHRHRIWGGMTTAPFQASQAPHLRRRTNLLSAAVTQGGSPCGDAWGATSGYHPYAQRSAAPPPGQRLPRHTAHRCVRSGHRRPAVHIESPGDGAA